jgi:hypothetical protein
LVADRYSRALAADYRPEVARAVIRLGYGLFLELRRHGVWFLRFHYRPNYDRRLRGMTEVDLSLWIMLAALGVALGSLMTLLR